MNTLKKSCELGLTQDDRWALLNKTTNVTERENILSELLYHHRNVGEVQKILHQAPNGSEVAENALATLGEFEQKDPAGMTDSL